MINKLYNLKKNQTDQILIQKSQIDSRIDQIDAEILLTKNSIASATVQKNGAIADFMILTMHKDTMKLHIAKLESEKAKLNEELNINSNPARIIRRIKFRVNGKSVFNWCRTSFIGNIFNSISELVFSCDEKLCNCLVNS